jgi:CubicO group peptidase (beta-lactamase class C family)
MYEKFKLKSLFLYKSVFTMFKYLLIIFFTFSLSSCYFFKALKYKKYKLEALEDFPATRFTPTNSNFKFTKGSIAQAQKMELDSMLIGSNRYAFVVIRNDSVLYEFYNQNITDSTKLPSFSVAKSFVSSMIQIAKQEGKIKNYDEPITNYIPELSERDTRFKNITIQHVLDMRSGIKFDENYYNPLSDVLKMGFGRNVNKKALNIDIESEPNLAFNYKSINTQLLGIIIERATQAKLQDYFRDKIYNPLGMQHEATWMYDDESHKELRAFCCLNMTAIDYARFGKLYLDQGIFNGKKILDIDWVKTTSSPEIMQQFGGYKNQFWQWSHSQKTYYARGLLNQYIIISPDKKTIIIHFGNSQNPNNPLKKGLMEKLNSYL